MKDLIWNALSPDVIVNSIIEHREYAISSILNRLGPPSLTEWDTIATGHFCEIGIPSYGADTEWLEADDSIWRSWTGLRRLNGDDYHGPIYISTTLDIWDGQRECACATCSESVKPTLRRS